MQAVSLNFSEELFCVFMKGLFVKQTKIMFVCVWHDSCLSHEEDDLLSQNVKTWVIKKCNAKTVQN